jgi:hypothetical protein
MPKTFYTERDIEDLVRQGIRSLIVDEDVVLTDLAYEKARRLGLELLQPNDQPPAAPVRPYIAGPSSPPASGSARPTPEATPIPGAGSPRPTDAPSAKGDDALYQRVYNASLARLGDSVDPKLLAVIVERVLKSISTR